MTTLTRDARIPALDLEFSQAYPRLCRDFEGGRPASLIGSTAELDPPLADVRGTYLVAVIRSHEEILGLLYLDGALEVDERLRSLVETLAAIAAGALRTSELYVDAHRLSTCDPLTGLLNRRAFDAALAGAIARARALNENQALVMVDLDDLKSVNDRGGHVEGDQILKRLAETLAVNAGTDSAVARIGGDEFAILLTRADEIAAREWLRRLVESLRAARLGCSLGAAIFPKDAADATGLLAAADAALYAVKRAGKNGYAFAPARAGI